MAEYAPPPPKVRVTQAQLRKVQANYQKAQALAQDLSAEEEKTRKKELAKIEKDIKNLL